MGFDFPLCFFEFEFSHNLGRLLLFTLWKISPDE